MQQNSNKSKYGRKRLPYWFQTGDGINDLKYGSSRKIREIWQPYERRVEGTTRVGVAAD